MGVCLPASMEPGAACAVSFNMDWLWASVDFFRWRTVSQNFRHGQRWRTGVRSGSYMGLPVLWPAPVDAAFRFAHRGDGRRLCARTALGRASIESAIADRVGLGLGQNAARRVVRTEKQDMDGSGRDRHRLGPWQCVSLKHLPVCAKTHAWMAARGLPLVFVRPMSTVVPSFWCMAAVLAPQQVSRGVSTWFI